MSSDSEKQAQTLSTGGPSLGEIVIGVIKAINNDGAPMVDFPGSPASSPVMALTTVSVHRQHVGRQVALLFNRGDVSAPVIMGMIQNPLDSVLELQPSSTKEGEKPGKTGDEVYIDGNKLVLEGKEQVVLKCGEASITLTKAGKILIRGKYVLSRSGGVNRIMGGSVQIN